MVPDAEALAFAIYAQHDFVKKYCFDDVVVLRASESESLRWQYEYRVDLYIVFFQPYLLLNTINFIY